jgi:hypothetical protein
MAKRGAKSALETHPKQKELKSDLLDGVLSFKELEAKWGFPSARLKQWKARVRIEAKDAIRGRPAPAPEMPDVAPGASPVERAKVHLDWLRGKINWAERSEQSAKDIAHLAGQYTNANRLYSRLAGALDITEAQIVRSAPFARVVAVIRGVLSRDPDAKVTRRELLRELTSELEAYLEGERR